MHHVTVRHHLDAKVLADILELIEDTTRIEGHPPVGEHKYAHLRVGAVDWAGITAVEDGQLVGYAHLRWGAGVPRVAVEVVVHPDHQTPDPADGIAPLLLREARRTLADAGGGAMWLWVHRVADPATTLAARMGFGVQRELAYMTRALGPVDEPALPRGHHGPPTPARRRRGRAARGEQRGVRRSPRERRVGPHRAGEPHGVAVVRPQGRVPRVARRRAAGLPLDQVARPRRRRAACPRRRGCHVLAIHPRAQGLGLGRRLLRTGLAHLHERDCREAILDVDRASRGAVKLYVSEDFALEYLDVCYEDEVAASPPAPVVELLRPA